MKIPKLSYPELEIKNFDSIIDVRSPSEFLLDHLPNAINLPVLFDEERALVGETYKQESRFKARKIGAALIAKNTAKHIEKSLFLNKREWKPLIYCWRGGQRSSAFSTILSEIGWRPTLLNGGYKNYRSTVSDVMHKKIIKHRFILISGHTGTAKTEIIKILKKLKLQTIDLEELANHRGSVFGSNLAKQPSQKLFESFLFYKLNALNYKRPIVLEAESNKIGQIVIPTMVWNAMKKSPRIEIQAPISERAIYLTRTYKTLTENTTELNRRLEFLKNQHGSKKIEEWKNYSEEKNFTKLATDLISSHYDPRYKNSLKKSSDLIFQLIKMKTITKQEIFDAAKKIFALIEDEVQQ